ncbi:MAG: dockerin type I domain-containing protein, partial [Chloroflexota bacterium]
YDLAVRVTDPDPEQKGAGFEISAETGAAHVGAFLLRDAVHTRFADNRTTDYVTHTRDGVNDSIVNWTAGGGSYEFILAWRAPPADAGSITFFTAGQAVNDALATGDHYYADYATIGFARPGDADGDTDVDLVDFAELQRCFNGAGPAAGDACEYVDFDDDGRVSLDDLDAWVNIHTGPTAALPAGFVLADPVRGGAIYDRWWVMNGAIAPIGDHPLYPDIGPQTGSVTFRCKECHGWDYKGLDGAYGKGSHFTGIRGVFGTTLNPRQMFDLLKADPLTTPNGHNMDAFGMSDRDLWDVVKFTSASVVDTDAYIAPDGAFIGDYFNGNDLYNTVCASCHGEDGMFLDLGHGVTPEYVGTVANQNPWEFLHKVRFGHPGSPMPRTDLLRWSVQYAA